MKARLTPYVNDDGEIWLERGIAPWVLVRREASSMAYEFGGVAIYDGKVDHVRVSDVHEWPHSEDDEGPDEDGVVVCRGCCRFIDAYAFHTEER